jgi:PAS domain S-box-containing protein
VAVGLGSLSLFNHYNATRIRQAQAALDHIELLRNYEDRIANALHLVRRLQPRANSVWSEASVQSHANAMAELDARFAGLPAGSDTSAVSGSLAEATEGFSTYRRMFEEFMRLRMEIGDSEGSGYAATLFRLRTQLRESIYTTLDADLLLAWENVSLAEQSYQAVPRTSNAERFRSSVESVRRIINVLWLSFERREEILTQITGYERALDTAVQKRAELNSVQGAVEEAFDRTLLAMAQMRATLHALANSASNALAEVWQSTNRSAVGGSIVIFIVTLLVSLVIGTRVSARVETMTGAMRALAKGDTSHVIPALGDADEIGDMARAMVVFRDNALALRESEARYQAVVEDQTEMISRHTPDGIRTFVNEAYCRFHGKPRDQLLGRSAYEGLAPEDLNRLKALYARLNVENPAAEFEVSFPGPDGETIWQLWTKRAIFDESGRATEFQAVGRDITERKRSEEASRELAAIVESTDDAVILERPDGTVIHWNTAAERIYGYSREEMIGKSVTILGPPDLSDKMPVMIEAMINGERISNFETVRQRKDGSLIEVSVTISPVKDEHGNVTAIAAIVRDITELKQTREQLQQAQKMEAMGQLTGGVAHDFNNLLAVIMGNAEVLAARLGDDNRPAQAVIRAASRGAELIGRLLAFSRTQPLRPQSINIDAVITEMSYMLHRTLGETVEIEIRIAPDLWPALADPSQLQSAILNLAINARDAMPNGGKLIIESANAPLDESYTASHSEVRPGDYVMLAVSDTGTGMSPAVLEHAFEPFFTTKEVGAGSGLGLSMVYGFAKQSDGEVSIHSEEGRGTTVRLYLPRAKAAADKAARETSTKEPNGRGETILVVEDDPDVRALAEVVLENLRYRVLTAEDGRTGLAVLEKAPGVDLLLSDVVLPGGMSGPDLAEQVSRRSPGLKVLFMSGYVDTAVQHHSPLPKNAELLNKPFRRNELAQKVRAMLDR